MTPDERRKELHKILYKVKGIKKVYFQPPEDVHMIFPCIVYKLDGGTTRYADNRPYSFERAYQLTAIYQEYFSDIPDQLAMLLPKIRFDKTFVTDNLYHAVFTLYY